MQTQESIVRHRIGEQLIYCCQAHPELANQLIDTLSHAGNPMAAMIARSIRQEIVAAREG